jgi:hypothetical protein
MIDSGIALKPRRLKQVNQWNGSMVCPAGIIDIILTYSSANAMINQIKEEFHLPDNFI